jgi:hypothetical protein
MLRMASPYPALDRLLILTLPERECQPPPGTHTTSVVRITLFGNMFDCLISTGGAAMSEISLEAPDADAAEQHTDALPEDGDTDEPAELPEPLLEVNEADSAEQAQTVSVDDDEYR